MTIGTPAFTDAAPTPAPARSRDAVHTRQLLLHAARRRFARDGYSTTTVRDIAADAGVNMALINRYFASKEGLFEACLTRTVEEFDNDDRGEVTVEHILKTVLRQVTDSPDGDYHLRLLLMLRTSGDEHADLIRRNTLRTFAERMAMAAGWRAGDDERLVLRAQVAMSTILGVVLLRSSTGLEPLTSASTDEFADVLGDVLATLLSPN